MTAILLSTLYDAVFSPDVSIQGIALDSRFIKPGYLFFAYRGKKMDGTQFIDDAIQRGASAILVEGTNQKTEFRKNIPIFYLPNLASVMSGIAARFFGNPSQKIKIVGVTGTNGKTSCTYFIAQALQQCHLTCGVIGTLGSGVYPDIHAGYLTTPDSITLQKTLSEFFLKKVKHAAIEVSSHSIDQGRIQHIDFSVGIFTNLTRDHLDYHGTMEAYGNTKRKLFTHSTMKNSIINIDDPFGRHILFSLANKKNVFAYSTKKEDSTVPLIYADRIELTANGMHFEVVTPWGHGHAHVPLMGKFNVSNVLAVLTTLCLLDIPFKMALASLSSLSSVPGRMQKIQYDHRPLVIVDYSHTPDALEKVLMALRAHVKGKLYCVFGCGGDRDAGKRPMMAKIAENHADFVFVTDDNPRSEDPKDIIKNMMTGFLHPTRPVIEHDRAKAIFEAIHEASEKDCVLIAGKGAEAYQLIGDEKIPFSDVDVVKKCLQ